MCFTLLKVGQFGLQTQLQKLSTLAFLFSFHFLSHWHLSFFTSLQNGIIRKEKKIFHLKKGIWNFTKYAGITAFHEYLIIIIKTGGWRKKSGCDIWEQQVWEGGCWHPLKTDMACCVAGSLCSFPHHLGSQTCFKKSLGIGSLSFAWRGVSLGVPMAFASSFPLWNLHAFFLYGSLHNTAS